MYPSHRSQLHHMRCHRTHFHRKDFLPSPLLPAAHTAAAAAAVGQGTSDSASSAHQDAEVSSVVALEADQKDSNFEAVAAVGEAWVACHIPACRRAALAHDNDNSSPPGPVQTSVCGQCAKGEKEGSVI